MISAFFINRPVLANVLAIVIVLIGGVALATLPIAQYPNIVPPTVQVTTTYPGASAKTVVENVALPIELQVNGVEGMIYMQSYSTDAGTYTLTVTFQIGTDLDFAQVLVQNRVSTALASLPASVQAQGLTVQKKSTSILQIVSLNSPDGRFDSLYLSNFATINLVNELSRLPGVGNVNVLGVGQYSMRVWLDPQKLYTYGLTPSEVTRVIQEQSQPVTAGQVGTPPAPKGQDFQFTVDIQGRLSTPEEFGNIIVKTAQGNGGRILRLKDIGRVELGAQTYSDLEDKRQAERQHRHLPASRGQRAGCRQRGQGQDGHARQGVPAGPGLRRAVRHDEVRDGLDQRGVPDLGRGWHPGPHRNRDLPAGLARHAGAGDDDPGDDHRRLRRHGGARLHHQHDDHVRHRVGDRHRRRRRHRDRRGRGPSYRARYDAPRRRHPGDERAVRAGHRHHPGADVGVPAGGLRARPHRQDVRTIRAGHRRDRLHQRHQRRDPETDAVRHVAASRHAAGEAQLLLPRLQQRLSARRERLCLAGRQHGATRRPHGAARPRPGRRGRLGRRPPARGLHSQRGPGLPADRRAVARRRLAGAHR